MSHDRRGVNLAEPVQAEHGDRRRERPDQCHDDRDIAASREIGALDEGNTDDPRG